MATKTATSRVALTDQPRYADTGTITRVWDYTSTLSLTADIVINYAWKIPHGATITSVKVGGQLPCDGTSPAIIDVNLRYWNSVSAVAANVTLGSASISAAIRLPVDIANTAANLPYKLSVPDDSSVRYGLIYLEQAAPTSPTVSESIVFVVQYTMDA
jgi:hypothetical protein